MAHKESTRIKARWTLEQKCFKLFGFLFFFCFATTVQGKKAEHLLKFDADSETFELNQEALNEISKIPTGSSIRVIAFLGDARAGKSTVLNIIIHILSGSDLRDQSHIEEIFPSGNTIDSIVSVTPEVSIHVIHPQNDGGDSFILLDVQGINIGKDTLVDYLSLFATLISSDVNVFVHDRFDNNNLHFLFRMSRLHDLVFPDVHVEFAPLGVVIRNALRPPESYTIEGFVRDFIVEPTFEKSLQKERETIAKYFRKDQISVRQLPHVADREVLRDAGELSRSDYGFKIELLAAKFKGVPVKTSSTGLPLDGKALVKHAQGVVQSINKNSWFKFGNLYEVMENNNCKRNREEVIKDIFLLTADQVEHKIDGALNALKKKGVSESEINTARNDLQEIVKVKREEEEVKQKIDNAVKKMVDIKIKIEDNNEKFQKILAEKDREFAKERQAEENAKKKVNHLEQLCEEKRRSIQSLQEELSDSEGGWFGSMLPSLALLSDKT